MVNQRWNILLVDDDQEDFMLTREQLSESRGGKYALEWASTYEEGLEKIINHSYDAILMDYDLGGRTGLELTGKVTEQGCRSPIILLTGRGNYEVDLAAMQVGVTEYLPKSDATPTALDRAIRYAILQKQTEETLRKSKEELEARVLERTKLLTFQNQALADQIKERMRIQAELSEVQRRLIERDEDERLDLARELHDGPMQELYGIIFQLETLRTDIEAGQGEAPVNQVKEKILEVISTLRQMSRDLRPPALAPYGLEKAIRSHVEAFQQTYPDLSIHLFLDEDGQRLSESVRLALFRIYQVAINNVARHSQAKRVEVNFQISNEQVRLEIRDNGCGFQVPKRWFDFARQGHLGLVGAAERAEAAGGTLEVVSQPGRGTQVRVIIPSKSVPGITVEQ